MSGDPPVRRAVAGGKAWLAGLRRRGGAVLLWWLWLLLAAPLAMAAPAAAAPAEAPPPPPEATLRVFNREIFTFRAVALGAAPAERVRRAGQRIAEQLHAPGDYVVSTEPNPLGTLVKIDGNLMFLVTPADADQLQQETAEQAVERATAALRDAIEASRESRRAASIARSVAVAAAATAVTLGLLWLTLRAREVIERWLVERTGRHVDRLQLSGVALLRRERLTTVVHGFVAGLHLLVSLMLAYAWATLVLAQFPYTRVWSGRINSWLANLLVDIGSSILDAVPGLLTALVIFMIARVAARLLDTFFGRVHAGQIHIGWLDPDVVNPTRRLAKGAVWLFALAMAYPYLPGAQTDAFKGLSVLVGLMISIGSSNLVGHVGSGLILTYARIFHRGEYVRIAEHEGTVMELGMFATRLRTGLGEEVTLSNSLVLGAVTKNYSRAVRGAGYVLDTTVTIGYDTPWRQVHAMLIEAAGRTPGVLHDPAPRVFQTALSDFYPEYRLVCQAVPSDPLPRAMVLSTLHANIQDVFNEHGVQIMSPHYFDDPAAAKVVPKSKWFTPPAAGGEG